MGLNDDKEKMRQALTWLRTCDPCTDPFKAALEHINWVLAFSKDQELRAMAEEAEKDVLIHRGGQGRNGDGSWSPTDGQGCPFCGQIRGGGHGGGCPNTERYDEKGNVIT